MIVKTNKGYQVRSENGKPLSRTYPTKAQAQASLREIDYFKSKK